MRGAERFGGDRSEKGSYFLWKLVMHIQTKSILVFTQIVLVNKNNSRNLSTRKCMYEICTNEKATMNIVHNRLICSDRVRIQTLNLLIRSQMLYSIELRSQWAAKIINYSFRQIIFEYCILYNYENQMLVSRKRE